MKNKLHKVFRNEETWKHLEDVRTQRGVSDADIFRALVSILIAFCAGKPKSVFMDIIEVRWDKHKEEKEIHRIEKKKAYIAALLGNEAHDLN